MRCFEPSGIGTSLDTARRYTLLKANGYSITAKAPAALKYQTMKSVARLIPTYTLPVFLKK
jgi:hypothetical protein